MLEINFSGYNLIEGENNVWYLQVIDKVALKGNFREIVIYAVVKLGFNISEIDEAIKDMYETGTNAAHFGSNRSFIYSFEKDFYYKMAN